MESIIYITLCQGTHARTFSFDREGQSLLWIGMDDEPDAASALVCAEAAHNGLLLKVQNASRLLVPGSGHELGGPVLVDYASALMMGIVCGEGQQRASLYVRPALFAHAMRCCLVFRAKTSMTIGRDEVSDVLYDSLYVSAHHATLTFEEGRFYVRDLESGNATYVNDLMLEPYQRRALAVGDVVRILDLWWVVGDACLFATMPSAAQVRKMAAVRLVTLDRAPCARVVAGERSSRAPFYPAPWLTESLETKSMTVDPPPQRENESPQPLLMQVGPSMLMGVGAVYMGARAYAALMRGDDAMTLVPTVCMAVAMIGTTVIWPVLSYFYDKRRCRRKELARKSLYVAYLDGISSELVRLAAQQEQVLKDGCRPVSELLARAYTRSPLLMSHMTQGESFLCLRVGSGDVGLSVSIAWPKRRFALESDSLWDNLAQVRAEQPMLQNVPISIDLKRHRTVGIVGATDFVWELVRGLLVQVCALYSNKDVKLAFVADCDSKAEWEAFSFVPHIVDDMDDQRLVAVTSLGASRLDALIEALCIRRKQHCVVVCSNVEAYQRMRWVQGAVGGEGGVRLAVVFVGEHLHDLPRECSYLVDLTRSDLVGGALQGRMFARAAVGTTSVGFVPDIMTTREQAWTFSRQLAGIRLDQGGTHAHTRSTLGFLELFEAGQVSHLDVMRRWSQSDAASSLRVPVGINDQGARAWIDLHEHADGPHALIAGTTGSGKSEFIITLVLSLCTCFSPHEVAFLLIDYKGGGLAGAFDQVGMRLPHLSGTITNLDGGAIRRALISLRSELLRRQRLLREACAQTGEATMDATKYLALFRRGVVDDPMPHLVVVADEFAELKQQEPAFMDELMSAARIGRSLGIHLVLATQKPAGVINDQIWANARLKVSLRVADAADSREMLRRDDAAFLRDAGSFYALVGYDDEFWGGQAAYAAMPYVPKECYEEARDDTVRLLDEEGGVLASARPVSEHAVLRTTEFSATLERIVDVARERGMRTRPLWLEPLSPRISLEELEDRYGCDEAAVLPCVVGEMDDPALQRRVCLRMDVAREGATILYGTHGSGVEGLLRAMLVSLMRSCAADRLWIYGIDAGEGCLASLVGAPSVGEVVALADEQRVERLLGMVEDTIRRRRAMAEGATNEVPAIIVALVNLPALIEAYPELEDTLVTIVRDASHVGVYVLATADGPGSVHTRMRAGFLTSLPTMLADSADYGYVLGTSFDAPVPRSWRRGLALFEGEVYEFQGIAVGSASEDEDKAVHAWVRALQQGAVNRAPRVPVLPERVTCEHVAGVAGRDAWPVGLYTKELEPAYLDARGRSSLLVTGNDQRSLVAYVRGAMEALVHESVPCCVLDLSAQLGAFEGGVVIGEVEDANAYLADGHAHDAIVIVMDVARTFGALSREARTSLEAALAATEECAPLFVVVSEYWRISALYDDWYRQVVLQGRGLWVGSGFADQTVFHLSRMDPMYATHAGMRDGFLVEAGSIRSVTLIEEVDHA